MARERSKRGDEVAQGGTFAAEKAIMGQSTPGKGPDTGPVGSDPQAAKEFGGKNDFGARVDDTTERNYVAANTRASDPGRAQPHAGEDTSRTAGAGGNATGEGASSAGDIDTDFVGLGGAGLSQSGPDRDAKPGPDDSDGTSREFASGPPAKGESDPTGGRIAGTTVQREGDIETDAAGRGASAVSRPASGGIDDSFAGEISEGEASGDDNP